MARSDHPLSSLLLQPPHDQRGSACPEYQLSNTDMPHETVAADQGAPHDDVVAAGGEPLAVAQDQLQDENNAQDDVFLDAAAAVEDGVDDAQAELNAAAEMLVDEIVPAEEGHGDGVDYSVQAPVDVEEVPMEAADGATHLNAVYEPMQLQAYDPDAHQEYADAAVEPSPLDDEHVNEPVAELSIEPPTKRVKLENEDVTVVDHENSPSTLPSFSEYNAAEQRAAVALANTLDHMNSQTAQVVRAQDPNHRKKRKEFTASEKLQILAELDLPNPPSTRELISKYGLSKSSFHRWRQEGFKERLVAMASGEKVEAAESLVDVASIVNADTGPSLLYKGHKKRDMNDGLMPLKRALQNFISYNASLPEEQKYAIRSSFLQVKARELRNDLVASAMEREKEISKYKEQQYQMNYADPNEVGPQPLFSPNELKALKAFKGSKSWSCQIAGQLGLLQTEWSETAIANSQRYIDAAELATSGPLSGTVDVKRPKKPRLEFTAMDKIRILKEVEESNAQRKAEGLPVWTVEEICDRYGTSKSSLHRWRQQQRSGVLETVVDEGNREVKRIFRDKLTHIKRALIEYTQERDGEGVGYGMLQERALAVRDELLRGYEMLHGLPVGGAVQVSENAAATTFVAEGDLQDGAAVNEPVHAAPVNETTTTATSHNDPAADAIILEPDADPQEQSNNQDLNLDPQQPVQVSGDATSIAVAESGVQDGAAIDGAVDASVGTAPVNAANTDSPEPNADPQEQTSSEVAGMNNQESGSNSEQPKDEHTRLYTPLVPITDEEYHQLINFKASISWLRDVAKKFKFNMDASEETKLEWKEWEEGRRGAALDENYYEHVIPSQHSELPLLDSQTEEQQQDGVIGEEQVEEILNGKDMGEIM